MAYTANNFNSGDTLYASQLNKMDAQIIQNEVEMKALKSQIDNIVIEGGGLTLNVIYPIGSIYMSINNINPANLFGGEWEQIKDTFLLSAGDTYTAGATGGEAEHTLTVDEMPTHRHKAKINGGPNGKFASGNAITIYQVGPNSKGTFIGGTGANDTDDYCFIAEEGGNQPHNNMPPYLAVYMWKRIA